MPLLNGASHSVTAIAHTYVESALLDHTDLAELIRVRPGIGFHIDRNCAVGAGEKLRRVDVLLASDRGQRAARAPAAC